MAHPKTIDLKLTRFEAKIFADAVVRSAGLRFEVKEMITGNPAVQNLLQAWQDAQSKLTRHLAATLGNESKRVERDFATILKRSDPGFSHRYGEYCTTMENRLDAITFRDSVMTSVRSVMGYIIGHPYQRLDQIPKTSDAIERFVNFMGANKLAVRTQLSYLTYAIPFFREVLQTEIPENLTSRVHENAAAAAARRPKIPLPVRVTRPSHC